MYCFKWAKGLNKLPEAVEIRTRVFMEEQGYTCEFDELDAAALHVVLFSGREPVATGRTYPLEDGAFAIGRIAVVESARGRGAGRRVVEELERLAKEQGAERAVLNAQLHARGFYEKLGYTATGAETLDEGAPHLQMAKRL